MKNILLLTLILSLLTVNGQTEGNPPMKRWSVTIMPSVGLAYLMSNKTTRKIDSMGFHHQAIGSYGIALSTNYRLRNRIVVNVGLQYLVNGYFKFIDPLAILGANPNTGNELNRHTRINHLNIPISVDFSLSKNNKLKYGLGVFIGSVLSTRIKIEYTDKTPPVDAENLEKFSTDLGISNSISYSLRISSSLEMPIKANYNLGIKDISTTNEKLKTSNFQIGIGLRILL